MRRIPARGRCHNDRVHVVIAPDCFTGTLTAQQAAEAMAQGWRRTAPHDLLTLVPLSDGGPGFLDVLGYWSPMRQLVAHMREQGFLSSRGAAMIRFESDLEPLLAALESA